MIYKLSCWIIILDCWLDDVWYCSNEKNLQKWIFFSMILNIIHEYYSFLDMSRTHAYIKKLMSLMSSTHEWVRSVSKKQIWLMNSFFTHELNLWIHFLLMNWTHDHSKLYNKDKNKSIMIWTCFEDDDQKSDLVFMSDNSETKWEEITSAVYLKILKK